MPEGHTIHRYARLHGKRFRGSSLQVWSPQGRFAHGASILDGRTLSDVDALGKHLFYRFDGVPTLHVHLGLFGKFRVHASDPPPPTDGTRLAWSGEGGTLYLSGPTICELIDPDGEAHLRRRIGPDPLNGSREVDKFAEHLSRRTIPIGGALLDQKVVAGVGNVYRAEVLFLCGIHPDTPARDLSDAQIECLWDTIVAQLREGERRGRIVTVDPADAGAASKGELPKEERLYVYKRAGRPCRRCGDEIRRWEIGARKIWACPTCQPR